MVPISNTPNKNQQDITDTLFRCRRVVHLMKLGTWKTSSNTRLDSSEKAYLATIDTDASFAKDIVDAAIQFSQECMVHYIQSYYAMTCVDMLIEGTAESDDDEHIAVFSIDSEYTF